MSPFQEFRLWVRRAPVSERLAAGIGAVLALALLAWLLVPGDDGSSDGLVTAGEGGTAAATGPGGASGASGPGAAGGGAVGGGTASGGAGATAAPAGAGAAPTDPAAGGGAAPAAGGAGTEPAAGGEGQAQGAAGQTCAGGSATGVTDKEVKLAVGLTNIVGPAANNLFGIPTPDEQKAGFQAAIDGINGEGGIGCKKIVPQYFNINPTNQEELVQRCREIADAGVFAFADSGSYRDLSAVDCFGQRQVPYFGGYFTNLDQATRNHPYVFNLNLLDTTYRNALLAFKERGTFNTQSGFKKLGFLYRSCAGPLVEFTKQSIREVVPANAVVEYDVGCPTVFASPADLNQAILTFQRQGVTHVFTLGMLGDMANFTRTAEQQGFKPKYTMADDGIVSISYGSQAPNPDNFADAVVITTNRGGEEKTPGQTPTEGTNRCSAYLQAKGLPPAWDLPYAFGNMCNQLWMIKAAVEGAGQFKQDALADGLQRAKSIDFSYPQGPTDFQAAPQTTTGGQFYRAAQFFRDCSCWRLTDPEFRPILR